MSKPDGKSKPCKKKAVTIGSSKSGTPQQQKGSKKNTIKGSDKSKNQFSSPESGKGNKLGGGSSKPQQNNSSKNLNNEHDKTNIRGLKEILKNAQSGKCCKELPAKVRNAGEVKINHNNNYGKKNSSEPRSLEYDAKKKAADAALSRLDTVKIPGFIKENRENITSDKLAVQSVLFVCPMVNSNALPWNSWGALITNYLQNLNLTDKEVSTALTIQTLNSPENKVNECVEIIMTYLKNIITHPEDPKYRSIKKSNKVFSEKVLPIKGAEEFLEIAGFKKIVINSEKGKTETLLLPETPNWENIEFLLDVLKNAKPIIPQLYKNPEVLEANEAEKRVFLPDDFYDFTEHDVKVLRKNNWSAHNEDAPLMTKAMRQKQDNKYIAKYKYSVIRIRFPDNLFLQGTFSKYDSQKSVKEFINSCLNKPIDYELYSPSTRSPLSESDDNKTLYDLKLVPSTLINFIPVAKEKMPKVYLKSNLLKTIKKL